MRRVTKPIRREMKRRAAVEPVIGHVKAEHRMERNYLKGRDGDRANAVLAAAGYNFSLLVRWFETSFACPDRGNPQSCSYASNSVKIHQHGFFTGDQSMGSHRPSSGAAGFGHRQVAGKAAPSAAG